MKLHIDYYTYKIIFSIFASALNFFLTPVLDGNDTAQERFSHLDLGVCESLCGTAALFWGFGQGEGLCYAAALPCSRVAELSLPLA